MYDRANILGVPVACITRSQLVETIVQWAASSHREQPVTLTYANAHSLNRSSVDSGFREILQQANLVYADGISVVWASRLLGKPIPERATACDFMLDFVRGAAKQGLRLFLLGGAPGVAERAASSFCEHAPALRVVGWQHGYLDSRGDADVVGRVNDSLADVLLVGMGVPRQDQWIAAHRTELRVRVCWSVGAALDYFAGRERRAPKWWLNHNLEWAYRLLHQPRRLWRRYVLGNPLFVARVLWQYVRERWLAESPNRKS